MEGGHPLVSQSHVTIYIAPQGDPRKSSTTLNQFHCTPTWAPDTIKGLAQHYMSLQELNSCIGTLSMLDSALVHRPVDLLVSGVLGRLLLAWEHRPPPCRCTYGFTYTPVECFVHWRTCWVAGLRARDALAALVATCNALAIAQRNHLVKFIIIILTSDDVTL